MKSIPYLFIVFICFGCDGQMKNRTPEQATTPVKKKRPVSADNGKFFNLSDTRMMYGGKDSTQHFNISNLTLNEGQFHYGIGREAFPALLAPEFISLEAADTIWADSTRFLVGSLNGETKAYSVPDLTRHEIVNDSLGGKPVMAAYCILADLGAIYERTYDGKAFTFGLSGYTYYDPKVWDGLDGFVFWDRETESLWWPLVGKAVSGPLEGVPLLEMDKQYWEDVTWEQVKQKYPDAKVLTSGQDFERPLSWKKYEDVASIIEKYSN
ncbi:MAG: DUF3179 domain-containing (seleno)protein [Reichenbachiella sp.]|uniref:DUF3179 domain-containing (seleno)protein n=2 Tax=Reichenbachiella sp. TaxID=2184521 RepID=UPI0032645D69